MLYNAGPPRWSERPALPRGGAREEKRLDPRSIPSGAGVGLLARPTFEAIVRVRYEETDQGGVVYHANYFRYLEVARVELLRARGLDYAAVERAGGRLVVVEAAIRYRAPATFDDRLRVRIVGIRTGAARISVDYEVRRGARSDELEGGDEPLLVTATTHHAYIDVEGRPRRLPPAVRDALRWSDDGAAADPSRKE